jgi:hypothetical protein
MKCPNCGVENPATAARCGCGYQLSADSPAPKAKRSSATALAVGIVGLVLGIFGVIEGWHVWNKPSIPPPPAAPVYQTFQSAKRGFRIKVLQGWKTDDGDQMASFSGPGGINVRLQTGTTPQNLEAFSQANLASIRNVSKTYSDIELTHLGEPQHATLAGAPGYSVEYSLRVKGVDARGWQTWTVRNKVAYIFTFTAGKDSYASYLPIARTMADSLEPQ